MGEGMVNVQFELSIGLWSICLKDLSHTVPILGMLLPGGYRIGDRVKYELVLNSKEHELIGVETGEEGTIIGSAFSKHPDHFLVQFASCQKDVNPSAVSKVELKTYMVGQFGQS